MSSPEEILKSYWGFPSFRAKQRAIIQSILNKKDTIALLPTGGGKSICFQVPALLNDGVCIVISPLIALIEDQVTSLKNKGIKALQIPSGSSFDDIVSIFDNVKYGRCKFLYLSPERVQSKLIQDKLSELNISFFVIDEAHCISEWGHDFRPSYTKLNVLKEIKKDAPIVALTATATSKVLQDITSILSLASPSLFKQSFYKKHLAYQIFYTEDKFSKLDKIFTKNYTTAIIYVNSRNKTLEISKYLNNKGFKSSFYHGGMTSIDKKVAFDNWMTEKTPIMVATNAFGMGIDKANVKIVIHLDIPSSIENYVQEAGRAGRNEHKAFAVMLTNKGDIAYTKELQERAMPTISEVKEIHKKLYQHFQIPLGELPIDYFDFNLLQFCQKYKFIPSKTLNVLQILNNYGIIEINHYTQKQSRIQFLINNAKLIAYKNIHKAKRKLLDVILRMYGGVFEKEVKINEFIIAKNAGITSQKLIEFLDKLEADKVISYKKGGADSEIFFLVPREDDKTINRVGKEVKKFLELKEKKLAHIFRFIENNQICRSIQLLHYFGEQTDTNCGICDVCISNKRKPNKNVSQAIINLLSKDTPLSAKEIYLQLSYPEPDILIHLRELLAEEKIELTNFNKYYLR